MNTEATADFPHRFASCLVQILLVALALAQGLLFLALVPPWQHYDEPGHFEYAWLLAHHDNLWHPGKPDPAMRREVVASMQEHHFFWNLSEPEPGWWFNYTQLRHPPLYYMLVSLPLRLVSDLSMAEQLAVARLVSLLLFMVTVVAVIGGVRTLTPPGHILRWAVPLCLVLTPPFVDSMTAVNNDVAAVMFSTLFLWGSVQTVRAGLTWWRAAWVIVAALLAAASKNIALFAPALIPLVVVVALWKQRGWRWLWLVTALFVAGAALSVACIGWGDAARWYRWRGAGMQDADTRIAHPNAPHGRFAVQLEAPAGTRQHRLIAPLLPSDIIPLGGQTVTVGGWVWANQPARITAPGVAQSARAGEAYRPIDRTIAVSTTPAFVAWRYEVPAGTEALHYVFSAAPPPVNDGEPLRVFLDGAVLVEGAFPLEEPPQFDDATASTGTWGGQPFSNLVRNGSGEQATLRLRPWLQPLLASLDTGWGRTPWLLFAALCDVERSLQILIGYTGFIPLDGLFLRFSWGQIELNHPVLVWTVRGVVLLSLMGCLLWFVRSFRQPRGPGVVPSLLLLALLLLLAWGFTATRVLPKISEGVVYPVTRYALPSIFPTTLALVGGWWAWWQTWLPRRWSRAAVLVLICGMMLLDVAAIWKIWTYFYVLVR